MKTKLFYGFLMLVGFNSCGTHENPLAYQKDTHGRGKIEIYVEDSYKPLFKTSIYTFESLFPKARVKAQYLPEGQIIQSFFDNKVKTICISRDFTSKEKQFLKTKHVQVQSDIIAYDAVALIVHPDNKDTLISVDQLKKWISTNGAQWPNTHKDVKIVFDKVNSANFNYLTQLSGKNTLSENVYALNSNEQVIEYVKRNKQALGVIGVNWISDQEDFEVMNFLDSVRVMHVSLHDGGEGFQPYAGTVWTKEYPLHREMWMINKGNRSGLNTGFVLFMIGEKGQLIIQKSELVPAKAPVRLIQLTTQ